MIDIQKAGVRLVFNRLQRRSYKALINLYLGGGADTFNLVVPIDCAINTEYHAVRKTAAMQNANLLEVSTAGQSCSKFGVHYKLPILHSLYQAWLHVRLLCANGRSLSCNLQKHKCPEWLSPSDTSSEEIVGTRSH